MLDIQKSSLFLKPFRYTSQTREFSQAYKYTTHSIIVFREGWSSLYSFFFFYFFIDMYNVHSIFISQDFKRFLYSTRCNTTSSWVAHAICTSSFRWVSMITHRVVPLTFCCSTWVRGENNKPMLKIGFGWMILQFEILYFEFEKFSPILFFLIGIWFLGHFFVIYKNFAIHSSMRSNLPTVTYNL